MTPTGEVHPAEMVPARKLPEVLAVPGDILPDASLLAKRLPCRSDNNIRIYQAGIILLLENIFYQFIPYTLI